VVAIDAVKVRLDRRRRLAFPTCPIFAKIDNVGAQPTARTAASGRNAMMNASDTGLNHAGLARRTLLRRTFLRHLATAAGAAPLAPALLARTASAQTAPAHHDETSRETTPESRHETERLAAYAAGLRYEDLPPAVVQRAKDCIADTVAAIVYGAELPWSKIIVAQARRASAPGRSSVLGAGGGPVQPTAAAFANGALAHAFELDNLTKPDSGSHPGATVFTAALAVAQDHGINGRGPGGRGLSGRDLLTAFVAGTEIMIRIGHATKHSNEARGFHAPGTTGPFGAAAAAGRLMGFDAARMTNALGVAGSCAGGLLEFAHAGNGAMVKRLHLGRAAEGGVLAASLAADGFTGPSSVLEGGYGFLRVFCNDIDAAELTRGLGTEFFTLDIMLKRYACHITAHNPVEAVLDLRDAHKFAAADVAAITIAGNARMATTNNIPAPADMMMAQYSIPFSVALALHRDPVDPRSFDDTAARDPAILDLASRVKMTATPGQDRRNLAVTVTVALKDGREVSRTVTSFKGTPERPLAHAELQEKFLLLTQRLGRDRMLPLFDRLQAIEEERTLDWLNV
jgi:2-methylcitrate dehydratase PrpD